jgi:hypothetical protein
MYRWFQDIITESVYQGHHTRKVVQGLKYGMLLFIVPEVMFFFSFFWAFFHLYRQKIKSFFQRIFLVMTEIPIVEPGVWETLSTTFKGYCTPTGLIIGVFIGGVAAMGWNFSLGQTKLQILESNSQWSPLHSLSLGELKARLLPLKGKLSHLVDLLQAKQALYDSELTKLIAKYQIDLLHLPAQALDAELSDVEYLQRSNSLWATNRLISQKEIILEQINARLHRLENCLEELEAVTHKLGQPNAIESVTELSTQVDMMLNVANTTTIPCPLEGTVSMESLGIIFPLTSGVCIIGFCLWS